MPRTISSFLFVTLLSFTMHGQSSPVPLLNWPLVPASIAPGHQAFQLTVNGTGFLPGATVRWNGSLRHTEFVSSATLHADISAKDVASAMTALVTVVNPGTIASNPVFFQIRQSSPSVSGTTIPTGKIAGSASAADLNGDGSADLLLLQSGDCSDEIPGTLRVVLGRGNGKFHALPKQLMGWCDISNPVYGDFNGDGSVDLAVLSVFGFGGEPAIYLNQNDGTFAQGKILNSEFGVDNTEIQGGPADLNGDGKLDLVVASIGGETFQAALGNGDGTFLTSTPTYTIPGNGADYVAIGDFDGDGRLDLAFADFSGNIDIFLGNGDGSFRQAGSYPTAYGGRSIVAADLNGDGKLDLVTEGASVLLGNGDGTFTSVGGQQLTASYSALVVIGDFNGDGKLDAVVGRSYPAQNSWLLLGNGDGTFRTPIAFPGSGTLQGPWVSDFNNDGKLDLIDGRLFLQK